MLYVVAGKRYKIQNNTLAPPLNTAPICRKYSVDTYTHRSLTVRKVLI